MLKSTFLPFLNILGFNTKIIEAFEKKYVILGQFPLSTFSFFLDDSCVSTAHGENIAIYIQGALML
jgi:hypothetical protein